jgi:hypothetical protein
MLFATLKAQQKDLPLSGTTSVSPESEKETKVTATLGFAQDPIKDFQYFSTNQILKRGDSIFMSGQLPQIKADMVFLVEINWFCFLLNLSDFFQ